LRAFAAQNNLSTVLGCINQVAYKALDVIRVEDTARCVGRRFIHGGRRTVRAVLYMAALVACIRKLLTILNTIARTGTPWSEDIASGILTTA